MVMRAVKDKGVLRLPLTITPYVLCMVLGWGSTWAINGKIIKDNASDLVDCKAATNANAKDIGKTRSDMCLADTELRAEIKNSVDVTNTRLEAIDTALTEIKGALAGMHKR